MSGDALHQDDRILVFKQPGESPQQAAERYMRQRHPNMKRYYMWGDDSTFDVWAPGLLVFTLSVE